MNYRVYSIVIISLTVIFLIEQIIMLSVSRKRARERGILRTKYPIFNVHTGIEAFIVFLGIFMIIMGATIIPRDNEKIALYQTWIDGTDPNVPENAELYTKWLEHAKTALARDLYYMVWSVSIIIISLWGIFTRGAYVTKDGVMFFGALKSEKTSVRAECGEFNFYIGKKQRYAFCLPLGEENEKLFAEFIPPETDAPIQESV